MRRIGRGRWAASFAVVLVPGCALATDLDGFSGGPSSSAPDGAPPDASSPATDATGATDAMDAMKTDAPVAGCIGVFCDAFDDGRPSARGAWDRMEGPSERFSLTASSPLSAPGALHVAGASSGLAYLAKSFPGPSIAVDLDLRLDASPSATGDIDVVTIKFEPRPSGVTNQLICLALSTSDAQFEWYYVDGAGPHLEEKPVRVGLGQWHHLRMTLDPADGQTVRATIRIDSDNPQTITIPRSSITGAELQVGFTLGTGTIMESTLAYDNVVVSVP